MGHFGLFDDDRFCWLIPIRMKFEPFWQQMMESLYGQAYCQHYGYGAIHNIHGMKVFWSTSTPHLWCARYTPESIGSLCQPVLPLPDDAALQIPVPVVTYMEIDRLADQGEQLLRQQTLNRQVDEDEDDAGEEWKRE